MIELRKRKRNMGGRPELPLDVVFQVLIRLPLRQLIRCMFVSKFWCSIIRQPSFIQAYLSRNPYSLILSIPPQVHDAVPDLRRLYCSNIPGSGQDDFFNMFRSDFFSNLVGNNGAGMTQIINEFVCFYHHTDVILANVFSGEVRRLPGPHVTKTPAEAIRDDSSTKSYLGHDVNKRPPGFIPDNSSIKYYLGYDSMKRLYKLVCAIVMALPSNASRHITDIRILSFGVGVGSDGDISWNTVLRRPPCYNIPDFRNLQTSNSILVNGFLYWLGNKGSYWPRFWCFDLTMEKFLFSGWFPIPTKFMERPHLVQFRGKISLFSCVEKEMIISTFLASSSNLHDWDWRNTDAYLPVEFQCDDEYNAIPIGNLPTGELLLANPRIESSAIPVYTYDDEKREFVRLFSIGKFPYPVDLEKWEIGTVLRNCEMLEALFSRV